MIDRLIRYLARLGQKIIITDGVHPSGLSLLWLKIMIGMNYH